MRIKLNKKWYLLLGISPIPALIPLFGTISCGSNSTDKTINNPILYDDLPKDYTTQDYKTAINTFRDKVAKMKNEKIVTEVNQITQALGKLNNTAYEGLEPFITKEMDNKIDPKTIIFTDQKAQSIYDFFAARTSKYFFPTQEQIREEAIEQQKPSIPDFLSEEEKKELEEQWKEWLKNKNLVNGSISLHSMIHFSLSKPQYPIHKLLILANQFLSKNPDPTQWAIGDEKNTIGNLICELNFWISYRGGSFTNEDNVKQPWIIPNKDFFKKDMDLFTGNTNGYKFENLEFTKNTWHKMKGIFLFNDKYFFDLFYLASGEPIISKISK